MEFTGYSVRCKEPKCGKSYLAGEGEQIPMFCYCGGELFLREVKMRYEDPQHPDQEVAGTSDGFVSIRNVFGLKPGEKLDPNKPEDLERTKEIVYTLILRARRSAGSRS